MEGNSNKKRKNAENDDKVYRFQVLLPNDLTVKVVKRNPVNDSICKEAFVEVVKGKCSALLKQTRNIEGFEKSKRKILWSSKEMYLEDMFGRKIRGDICFGQFKPNKTIFLRLYDGAGQTVDSFQNMWDLTPDTDLLSELPDDYTFETALADLIDNSLQAVWSNKKDERKLISIEIDNDRVSIFDTGPGMDGSPENSIAKWGKMGASIHRSSKNLGIGGKPPFLKPFFGMFGYGGTIASMHLGRHAIVSAKTKESKEVYWLRLERDALLKQSGSSSLLNWKVPGGIRDPTDDEIEMSEHGSFLKIEMLPKLKVPDLFQLQCKLKDIYFPYIQFDEISGRTATLVEFQVNKVNLAEIDGGEFAITNMHSCNGPEFVLDIHFSTEEDKTASKCQSKKEANARLKCVYFPIIEGKENIDRILEKMNEDGYGIKEDFQTFSRISIRRLGRLLPDARWDLLPFMKPKQKRGEKLQILKRCCLRVKCFMDTDAGFNPIPSKTDLALHHPFTKALKELGGDPPLKGVSYRILRSGKQLSLPQLEREYQNWILQMHSDYDEEFSCGDDEPTIIIAANKEELGITSDVVRVHEAVTRKGKSWTRGQKIKILKGACTGYHKTTTYATIEYFLLENLQGDAGVEARIICRPEEVQVLAGAKLTNDVLELHSSISIPMTVIDSGKCVALSDDDWKVHVGKQNLKLPSSIEVLNLKQCNDLEIDGALPSGAIISAGLEPPKEVVAVLRPSSFTSRSATDNLDQKYIIKENHEMCMDVTFKADSSESSMADHIFSASVTNTSRRGCQGLYIFPLGSIRHLFQKAGIYSFSFSLKKSACASCEISVQVKASSQIESWKLVKDDENLAFDVSVGSCFPTFSVACFDKYDNCVAFNSIPEVLFKLMSDEVVLSPVKSVRVEVSSDKLSIIARNLRVVTDNLDKIRPSYKATLVLSQRNDKSTILSIPCRVVPGTPKSVTFHLPEFGIHWLPRQVVEDIKLEIFDRHNNHVKGGLEVELELHGFSFEDQFGKVDDEGFVDLSGVLKVSEGYGKIVSISVLYNNQVLLFKKFLVEKRELRMTTRVPDVCQAGSKLKEIIFEVVDGEGKIDPTIHDNNKHGLPHTLKIRTGLTDNDSLRYVFRKGRCVVPSITLPKQGGDIFIEAVHSNHPELLLKFKVNIRQSKQEGAFSSLSQTSVPKKTSEKLIDHSTTIPFEDVASLSQIILDENEPNLIQTPKKNYDSNDKLEDHIFQTPELKATSVDPVTPDVEIRSMITDLKDIEDMEKEVLIHGSRINDHEDKLRKYELRKDVIEELVRKDCDELLQLQASMEPVPLSVSYCMSVEDAMVEKIGNRVESAAALYSIVSRDMSLRDQHPTFMDDVVGVVALIGTAPTPKLSRSLAEYLGEDQMLAVVCQSNAPITSPEKYECELNSLASELGTCIKGSHLFICLEDIRAFAGSFVEGNSQKRLALLDPISPDGITPPGFLGFAVNMIDIGIKHLQTKTSSGHGLRETLFYRLFGELQVYETKEHMKQAYCAGCLKNDALSLDGGILRGNGMISLGYKELDVHFPVIAEQNQLVSYSQTAGDMEEIEKTAKKKQQQIEEYKSELNLLELAINHVSQERSEEYKQFKGKEASLRKLLESKQKYFSQRSSQTTPINFQSPDV